METRGEHAPARRQPRRLAGAGEVDEAEPVRRAGGHRRDHVVRSSAAALRRCARTGTAHHARGFAWLAAAGINAVRIPLGHWIFGPPYPYHAAYGANPHPFVEGGIGCSTAPWTGPRNLGLRVVLTCAAPGCQNGFDNGGIRTSASGTRARSTWRTRSRCWGARRAIATPRLHAIEV
jgi:hypothetical protein